MRALEVAALEQSRAVGKRGLPTTVAGLLVHIADHTQRHVGQAITTGKILHGADRLRSECRKDRHKLRALVCLYSITWGTLAPTSTMCRCGSK